MIKFVVLAFLAAQASANLLPKCVGPNESYTKCGPSCGGDGCNAIAYPAPCVQKCQSGCFCDCGYFRNSKGICVPAEECEGLSNVDYPKHCPGHQCQGKYQYFTNSTDCINTCEPNDLVCVPEASPGCFCLPGYKQNPKTLECVPVDECPCPPFETREGCAGACESCGFHVNKANGKSVACSLICFVDKCHCIEGYLRNSKGHCIPREECLSGAGTS